MPMTSLTWTSRQARTQRVQWMQASRLTAIAGWLGSGGLAARAGSGSCRRPSRRPSARACESGSCAILARRLVGEQQLHAPCGARSSPAPRRSPPSCRRSACGCRRRPARARPRSRPCRRGNCRRPGSRARAASTDAGSRCPGAWRPARWSRRAGLDLVAVEGEADRIGHDGNLNKICHCRANTPRTTAISKPVIHLSRRRSLSIRPMRSHLSRKRRPRGTSSSKLRLLATLPRNPVDTRDVAGYSAACQL